MRKRIKNADFFKSAFFNAIGPTGSAGGGVCEEAFALSIERSELLKLPDWGCAYWSVKIVTHIFGKA